MPLARSVAMRLRPQARPARLPQTHVRRVAAARQPPGLPLGAPCSAGHPAPPPGVPLRAARGSAARRTPASAPRRSLHDGRVTEQQAATAATRIEGLRARLEGDARLGDFLPPVDPEVLTDKLGREHRYLRISLTEKCSLRCQYCMPAEGVPLQPKDTMLSTDEVVTLAEMFVAAGITKIRLTGGEPLVNPDIVEICQRIGALPGLKDLGITTNGLVLEKKLPELQAAGVNQLNVSLDTLVAEKFEFITRRKGFQRVVGAIEAAIAAGYHHAGEETIKVNVCVMNGFNEDEISDFVSWTESLPVDVRFIEWMPFGGNKWNDKKFYSYQQMLEKIEVTHPAFARHIDGPNDTAKHWQVPGYEGRVGFITSMSENFCGTCNRLRITADGNLKVCLFDNKEVSLRDILRSGASTEEIYELVEATVKKKKPKLGGHGDMYGISKSDNRSMITIGG